MTVDLPSATGSPTTRFAPSPTGELHLGHALSALTGWHWAQKHRGRFLLRIEDIDTGRARERFVAQIFDDLAWLGLAWETPVLRQSDHFAFYRREAARLEAMGLLYPCFATRREIADAVGDDRDVQVDPDGAALYPGLHKGMARAELAERQAAGEPFALRIDMMEAIARAAEITGDREITYTSVSLEGEADVRVADPARWGDAVIVRKDVPASYHLAVVLDDARQGVTHVTRGQDLEAATDLHRLLQILLGLPAPVYHHHALLLGADGRKFSKSDKAVSLRALRAQGLSRGDVLEMVGLG